MGGMRRSLCKIPYGADKRMGSSVSPLSVSPLVFALLVFYPVAMKLLWQEEFHQGGCFMDAWKRYRGMWMALLLVAC